MIGVSGRMLLLVPAHLGCPRQNPESRKTVVCVCVCVFKANYKHIGSCCFWCRMVLAVAASATGVHIMAVQFAAGLNIGLHRKQTNLPVIRCKAQSGRKQGHKRGLDWVEMCAKHKMVNFACYVTLLSHCITWYSSEARNLGVCQRSCAI